MTTEFPVVADIAGWIDFCCQSNDIAGAYCWIAQQGLSIQAAYTLDVKKSLASHQNDGLSQAQKRNGSPSTAEVQLVILALLLTVCALAPSNASHPIISADNDYHHQEPRENRKNHRLAHTTGVLQLKVNDQLWRGFAMGQKTTCCSTTDRNAYNKYVSQQDYWRPFSLQIVLVDISLINWR